MLLPTEEIDADQALLSIGATLISLLEPVTVAHLREGRVPRQAGPPPAPGYWLPASAHDLGDELAAAAQGPGQREPVEGDPRVTARAPGVLTEPFPQVRDRRRRLEQ